MSSEQNIIVEHLSRRAEAGCYPPGLGTVLSSDMAAEAVREIGGWPGYAPTPLRNLDLLARDLGLRAIYYKDEGERFGLGSFKALGGAYAVQRLAADRLEAETGTRPSLSAIRAGDFAERLKDLTVVTATDGNHGRSVAWGAQMAGCRCRIYIHAGVSEGRRRAMEEFGAEVVRIDGDYDASVHRCAQDAAENCWYVVSDTSYDGYMDLPRYVMSGYTVMASEVLDQMAPEVPTHVFVQAGVGGLAAAICARFWQELGERRPRFAIVEPERAACLMATARAGKPTAVELEQETLMAGLSCGEVSLLAWDILERGAEHFLTIGEEQVAPTMRLLATGQAGGGKIVAGESAVPGLIGLIGAARDTSLRTAMDLGGESRVLVFGCEGATDPEIYETLVADGA